MKLLALSPNTASSSTTDRLLPLAGLGLAATLTLPTSVAPPVRLRDDLSATALLDATDRVITLTRHDWAGITAAKTEPWDHDVERDLAPYVPAASTRRVRLHVRSMGLGLPLDDREG